MVVGFEKMNPGSLQSYFQDRANPTGTSAEMMKATRGITNAPGAAQMFGNAGREYMEKYSDPSCLDKTCTNRKSTGTEPKTKTSLRSRESTTSTPSETHTLNSKTSIPSNKS